MKNTFKMAAIAMLATVATSSAFAEEAAGAAASVASSGSGLVALSAGLAIGLAVIGGTLGQAKTASAALEGIARNPAAQGKIFVPMILGLALIESLVVLSFLISNGLASHIK